jgi:hypothetical protein
VTIVTLKSVIRHKYKEGESLFPSGDLQCSRYNKTDSKHTWNEREFSPASLKKCGFCGESMKKAKGFKCASMSRVLKFVKVHLGCKYPCHGECKDNIPWDCSKDPKNPILHFKQTTTTSKRKTWGARKGAAILRKSHGDGKRFLD